MCGHCQGIPPRLGLGPAPGRWLSAKALGVSDRRGRNARRTPPTPFSWKETFPPPSSLPLEKQIFAVTMLRKATRRRKKWIWELNVAQRGAAEEQETRRGRAQACHGELRHPPPGGEASTCWACEPPAAALEGAPLSPGPKLSSAPLGGTPRASSLPGWMSAGDLCLSHAGLGEGVDSHGPGILGMENAGVYVLGGGRVQPAT